MAVGGSEQGRFSAFPSTLDNLSKEKLPPYRGQWDKNLYIYIAGME